MNPEILYFAGFGAGLFYLLGDILGGIITPNYNYIRNAVSELVQSGAKNRLILSVFLFLHALMIVLFSIGILSMHPLSVSVPIFIGGLLLLGLGLCHALSSSIFPMDPVGEESTIPGTMHLVLVGITVVAILFLVTLLGLGLTQLYGWQYFDAFSYFCLAVIAIGGISSPLVIGKGIEVMGLTERITAYTFYIWLAVMAYLLLGEAIG